MKMSLVILWFKTEDSTKNTILFLGERDIPFLISFDEVVDWVSGRDFNIFELISLD